MGGTDREQPVTVVRVLGRGLVRWLEILVIACAVGSGVLGLLLPSSGHQLIAVTSGSMEPAIPAGALAIVEPVGAADLRVGDVVTIRLVSGALVTHRVIGTAADGGGPSVVVRGDANDLSTAEAVPRSEERRVGKECRL